MTILLTILHIVVSFLLILVVLAQQGKGQDLASAFGGGGSSAAFGARGAATFLAKVTTIAAVLFMLTSLGLSYFRPAVTGGTVIPDDAPPAQTLPSDVGPEEVPPPEGTPPLEGEDQPDAQEGEGAQESGAKTGDQEPAPPDQP
jgi:preprotein translocase subunit SecG